MALLPQELSGTQERTGGLLPANNGTPLVVYLRQVTVGLDEIFVKITEQRLRSRTDTQALLQILQAALGHPGNLRCKTFYVILLFFQQALRDEHGHVYILYPCLLEPTVQLLLNIFPDGITGGFDDHAAFYAGIIGQLGLLYHVRIPLCEIHIHGCDRFY